MTSHDPAPLFYGHLRLDSRYLLSPLAGYTNLPFRRVVREIGGVGLCTTDLVSARGLLAGNRKSMQLVETCPEDSPFAVQIFGPDPVEMRDAAQLLEGRGVHSVDINMGCPVARITTGGAGSAMMCRRDQTVELVRTVVEAVKIPVTVKMRLGWDATQLTAPLFAREFEQVGVAAVAIHGRTREQGFRGKVSLDGIRAVVEAVERIPVIGNGDIRTVEDARAMFAATGCAGISIGRGALANPWIFQQLVEWETTGQWTRQGTFSERIDLLKRQLTYYQKQIGEMEAIRLFRRTAHWYLKSLQVRADLRNRYQTAATTAEVDQILAEVRASGPRWKGSSPVPPEFSIPVPGGPVAHW